MDGSGSPHRRVAASFPIRALKSSGCTSSAAAVAATGMFAAQYSAIRSIWRLSGFQVIDSESHSGVPNTSPTNAHRRHPAMPLAGCLSLAQMPGARCRSVADPRELCLDNRHARLCRPRIPTFLKTEPRCRSQLNPEPASNPTPAQAANPPTKNSRAQVGYFA